MIIIFWITFALASSPEEIIRMHWESYAPIPAAFRILSRSFHDAIRKHELRQFATSFSRVAYSQLNAQAIMSFDAQTHILDLHFHAQALIYFPFREFPRGLKFRLISASKQFVMYSLNGRLTLKNQMIHFKEEKPQLGLDIYPLDMEMGIIRCYTLASSDVWVKLEVLPLF